MEEARDEVKPSRSGASSDVCLWCRSRRWSGATCSGFGSLAWSLPCLVDVVGPPRWPWSIVELGFVCKSCALGRRPSSKWICGLFMSSKTLAPPVLGLFRTKLSVVSECFLRVCLQALIRFVDLQVSTRLLSVLPQTVTRTGGGTRVSSRKLSRSGGQRTYQLLLTVSSLFFPLVVRLAVTRGSRSYLNRSAWALKWIKRKTNRKQIPSQQQVDVMAVRQVDWDVGSSLFEPKEKRVPFS